MSETGIGTRDSEGISAALLNGTICVVARGWSSDGLQASISDVSVEPVTWSVQSTGFKTSATPSIVVEGGIFHVYSRDLAGGGIMHMTSADGKTWSGADYTGLNTSGGVCAIRFEDELHLLYRDVDGGGILHSIKSGSRWIGTKYIGINARWSISAAVLQDKLCVVCKDNEGISPNASSGIMCAVLQNETWSSAYTRFNTTGTPGIAVVPIAFADREAGDAPAVPLRDVFQVWNRDPEGGGILQMISSDGLSWRGGQYIGINTNGPVGATSSSTRLWLFYTQDLGSKHDIVSTMYTLS